MDLTRIRDYYGNVATFPFDFGDVDNGNFFRIESDGKIYKYENALLVGEFSIRHFVFVSDVASLVVALEDTQVLPILWAGGSLGSALVAELTTDKNIYCYSPGDFVFDIGGSVITFPTTLGAGETAFLNIYSGLTLDMPFGNSCFTTVGGVDSSTTGIRVTVVRKGDESNSNILGSTVSANAPITVENYDIIAPTTATNENFGLWSGLNTTGKTDRNNWRREGTTFNAPNDLIVEDIDLTAGFTGGYETYRRKVTRESTRVFEEIAGTFSGDFTNYILGLGIPSASEDYALVLGHDASIGGNTILSVGPDLNYPWKEYNAVETGKIATYTNGTVSGTVENAYYGGGTPAWRAKTTGTCQRIEFEADGSKVEYTSASTTVDLVITWIETKRTDVNGNIAYNEATIPASLNSVIKYTFRNTGCEYFVASNGTRGVCTGCYPNSGSLSFTSNIAGVITILIQSQTDYAHYKYTATLGEVVALASFTKTVIA